MGIKKRRPLSAGQRFKAIVDFSEITKDNPEKSLTFSKQRICGRNVFGRITMRRRGGGHKRLYRLIDFKRDKHLIAGTVKAVEYDPNRSANIALIYYADGEKRYIVCPNGLTVGKKVISGPEVDVTVGNAMPLANIPLGENVHNVELKPGKGAALVRSAGSSAQVMAKVGKYAQLRLPSGELRKVLLSCYATVGVVGNLDHSNQSFGKAGATRWKGRRPKVRGVAMNPVDHPHGGGEGKTSGGRHPVSPWGTPTKGYKTRANKRTEKFIIRHRQGRS